ncbi:uncharacterized protein C8A04DRAFT_10632 [Dichotomopilus funicola]|uniref:Uncharacterized protein n=1 Tax=Dichotomopilus funicola TaxID=1934379 RepID=A0AAN6V655_9PEZI|nr:hypothetical protein C8A04DRAFT_10632 [Dichotomopilus funicola]
MADNIPSGSEFRAARADSTSSSSSTSSTTGNAGTSTGHNTLQAQKRKDDPASLARRQSLNEQRPTAGFLGSMWNRFVLSFLFSPFIILPFILPIRFASCFRYRYWAGENSAFYFPTYQHLMYHETL